MKIVVLDGRALAADDLNYEDFRQFGELEVYDNTAREDIVDHIGDSEIVLVNKVVLTRDILEKCPNLKLIQVMATGYNVVDLEAAAARGIAVANIPAYSTDSVAQYVFACILQFCNRIDVHNRSVHAGDWITSETFSYRVAPLCELAGKTLGIVGFGAIGKAVARIAKAFEMNVLVYSRTLYPQFESATLKFSDLNTLLQNADFVTLHCPLTAATQGMIGMEQLRMMKKSAVLINSARGPVVVERDLAQALEEGVIAAAAVDVLCHEPMQSDCPLYTAPNCVITPHIAWAPLETRRRLLQIAVSNLAGFIAGEPKNIVQ